MASYPASLKVFTTKVNKQDDASAEDINAIQDEIEAIQTELGTDVAGSVTDLKTRLAVSIADSGAVANGSSFPGSPTANQLFYRTDLDKLYTRDAANAAWSVVGENLSNVLFQYNACVDNQVAIASSSLTATSGQTYTYLGTSATSYTTVLKSKIIKISGVNTAKVYCQLWTSTSNSTTPNFQIDIGGQTLTLGSGTATTPTWFNGDLDISSLTNGTVYDIDISLKQGGAQQGDTIYLGNLMVFGES